MKYFIHLSILLSAGIPIMESCGRNPVPEVSIDPAAKTIRFGGTIHPKRYNSHTDRANGHHFIVWSRGANATKALIMTEVSDLEILKALETIGAALGNNLSEATWEQRADPAASAPDQRVEGSRLEIWIEWDGWEHRLPDLFTEKTMLSAPEDMKNSSPSGGRGVSRACFRVPEEKPAMPPSPSAINIGTKKPSGPTKRSSPRMAHRYG